MIKGKVVDIIDNRTIAINIGSKNGAKLGMTFLVLKDEGKEIHDPDTGELLGKVKLPKIKVKVMQVETKFSLAETYEYENINVGGINTLSNVTSILTPPKYIKKYKTFEIDNEQRAKISEEQSIVKIGDSVEQIEEGNL